MTFNPLINVLLYICSQQGDTTLLLSVIWPLQLTGYWIINHNNWNKLKGSNMDQKYIYISKFYYLIIYQHILCAARLKYKMFDITWC